MLLFILKRVMMIIPILIAILVIVFTISYLMPGDPALMMMPSDYTQEQYDAKVIQLGLDKPYIVQLWTYISNIIGRFDLGTSYNTGQSVNEFISGRIGVTIRVGLMSCIVTLLIAVPLGIVSAVKQYSPLDYTATTFAIFLASMPGFWLALMMILLFSLTLGWLPASGLYSWKHYILPVLCNGLGPLAQIMRMTRSSMLEVIRQDYIRTARSKGLTEKAIIFRHALRNALIPIITVSGVQFSHILGGSVIIENIFSIPGMGAALVTAIGNRDYPAIMGITFLISAFVCVINMTIDILYAVVDPRIKAKIMESKHRHKKQTAGCGCKEGIA